MMHVFMDMFGQGALLPNKHKHTWLDTDTESIALWEAFPVHCMWPVSSSGKHQVEKTNNLQCLSQKTGEGGEQNFELRNDFRWIWIAAISVDSASL